MNRNINDIQPWYKQEFKLESWLSNALLDEQLAFEQEI